MQSPAEVKRAFGIVYITTMSRPDSALALALICGLDGKKEARLAAIAVAGSGLAAAAFCDAVERVYLPPGAFNNSNNLLPVGLDADDPLPTDPPMVKAALAHHVTFRVSDTAEVPALIRNSLTNQTDANAAVILSAPATSLQRTLKLPGVRDLFAAKVKELIVCDGGGPQDAAALQGVLADWPTRIVYCDRAVGEAVPYPASSIEKDFAWSPSHPVVEAYRSYRPMPYDAPSWDLAAVLYAVHPEGFFQLSDSGHIQPPDTAAQKEKIVRAYIETASAKPVPPTPRQKKAQI